MLEIISRESFAEVVNGITVKADAGCQSVSAECEKMFRAGAESFIKVEITIAAAGSFSRFSIETYHDGRERILLGKP
jgi:hypothetical protein